MEQHRILGSAPGIFQRADHPHAAAHAHYTAQATLATTASMRQLGLDLLQALGISAHRVAGFSLELDGEGIPRVVVTRYLLDDDLALVKAHLERQRFELVPLGEPQPLRQPEAPR